MHGNARGACRVVFATGLAAIAASSASIAQEGALGPEDLDEIVITATRTPSRMGDLGGGIDVVSPEEVPGPPTGLAGLLSTVLGVDAQGTFIGEKTTLNVRGLQGSYGTQRTLVMADGIPLNDGYLGDADLRLLGAGLFERVEVVRGPGSALYGGSALGGVVNLIPRRAGEEPEGEVALFGGDYGTLGASAAGGARSGPLDWYVSAETVKTDGYMKNPDGTFRDWESASYGARAGWALGGGHEVGLLAQRTTGEGQRDMFNEDLARGLYSLSYSFRSPMTEGAVFTARAFRSDTKDKMAWKMAPMTSDHDFAKDGLQLDQRLLLGGRHKLVFGAEVVADDLNGTEMGISVASYSTASAAFVQDEVDLGDWRLTLGARLDHEEAFGSEVSPRVGLVRKLGQSDKLYASVGKGYRAPAASDLYMPPTPGDASGNLYMGNADLEPEEHWAFEIGGAHGVGDSVRIEWSVYYDLGLDAWDYMEVDPGPPVKTYQAFNVTKQKTLGAEFRAEVDLGSGILLGIGCDHVHAVYDEYDPKPAIEGNLVEDVPEHSGTLSLAKEWGEGGRAELTLRCSVGRYTDPENTEADKLDGFSVLDARCEVPLGKGVSLTLAVENIFDVDYATSTWLGSVPFPQPGRSVYAGARARF
jgi:outer membrane receptor protein involved in Fe transport